MAAGAGESRAAEPVARVSLVEAAGHHGGVFNSASKRSRGLTLRAGKACLTLRTPRRGRPETVAPETRRQLAGGLKTRRSMAAGLAKRSRGLTLRAGKACLTLRTGEQIFGLRDPAAGAYNSATYDSYFVCYSSYDIFITLY